MFQSNDNESVEKVKNILNTNFNINLEKTTNKFDLFDIIDNNNKYIVEVKERSNNYSKYPTTMIGHNKYIEGLKYLKKGYNVLFVFCFVDGIYYYKLENDIFKPELGGRVDRGFREIKNYIYIKISELIKLE